MRIPTKVVTGVGGGMLTGLLNTVRFDIQGRHNYDDWWGAGKPVIFALWHGRLVPCSYYHRQQRLATLISQHRDGDYIAGVVERWWGYRAIRGSSSRGGSGALRDMVRTLRGGTAIAITPDGPRGPRQKMKVGPVVAAQLAGVPIIPVAAGCDRGWWLEGWDRFLIPKPFSRVQLVFGDPIFIARELTAAEVEGAALEIESLLNLMTDAVDRWAADAR